MNKVKEYLGYVFGLVTLIFAVLFLQQKKRAEVAETKVKLNEASEAVEKLDKEKEIQHEKSLNSERNYKSLLTKYKRGK